MEETPPQIVLGIHIGSAIFSLMLLFRVHERDGVLDIPSLGILISIAVGIINILLFIYFINYISHSIELYTIVKKLHKKTESEIEKLDDIDETAEKKQEQKYKIMDACQWYTYEAKESGFLQGVQKNDVIKLAKKHKMLIKMEAVFGSYIVIGTPIFSLSKKIEDNSVIAEINSFNTIYIREKISENLFYGFRQISEIAVKALSPGINDPSTAKFALST